MAKKRSKNPTGWKYIGVIGDVNPIEHWGGIIYDSGYGPHLLYFQSYDDRVTISNIPIEKDVTEDLDWVKWREVAAYIGMPVSELKGYAKSPNVFARADVYASVGSYHGFVNLDLYPEDITIKSAEKKHGRAVDAAHKAEERTRHRRKRVKQRHRVAPKSNPKSTKRVSSVRSLVARATK
jgi:hypothetical protein